MFDKLVVDRYARDVAADQVVKFASRNMFFHRNAKVFDEGSTDHGKDGKRFAVQRLIWLGNLGVPFIPMYVFVQKWRFAWIETKQ